MQEKPAAPGKRPLSPHLTVYRWGPHMLVSILHRLTGFGLAVGTLFLAWGLVATASGATAYAQFHGFLASPLGRFILFGLSFAFFQHLASGLRHLYLDTGAGYEIVGNRRSAVATLIASTTLTLFAWLAGYGLI
ncbi:MAG: succinate dehydrogenase, cytochrome b556 subunit [Pseudomonadota bacterium]